MSMDMDPGIGEENTCDSSGSNLLSVDTVEPATLLFCLTLNVGCFLGMAGVVQSWQPADYLPANHQRQQVQNTATCL